METRQVTQVHIFQLILNNMTDRAENCQLKAIAYDKDKLIQWYHEQKAPEMWKDDRFNKTFKQGSHIEWSNPLNNFEINHWGQGIDDLWVNQDDLHSFLHRRSDILLIQ